MEQHSPAGAATEKISSALNGIEAENPHLKAILQAFRGTLIEQARWKAELPIPDCPEIGRPDSERFGKGVSLTDQGMVLSTWRTLAHRRGTDDPGHDCRISQAPT